MTHLHKKAPPARWIRVLAAIGILALLPLASGTHSNGAWFTAQRSLPDNAVQSAALQPPSTLTATATASGTNVTWNSALDQRWAAANGVASGVSYTLARTLADGTSQTISQGAATSFFDANPAAQAVVTAVDARSTSGAGMYTYIALDTTGHAWVRSVTAKYPDNYGSSGNGSTTASTTPTRWPVPGDPKLTQVVSLGYGNAALAEDGSVWASAQGGDLCDTARRSSHTVVNVPTPAHTQIVKLGGADCGLVQIASDGSAWIWTADDAPPARIPLPSGRMAVDAVGKDTILASDGTVWVYSFSEGDRHSPRVAQLAFPSGVVITRIAPGLALASNGDVWGWGSNYCGQLATGDAVTLRCQGPTYATPVKTRFPASTSIVALANTGYSSAVLYADGTVWAAGDIVSDRDDATSLTLEQWAQVISTPVRLSTPPVRLTQLSMTADISPLAIDSAGNSWTTARLHAGVSSFVSLDQGFPTAAQPKDGDGQRCDGGVKPSLGYCPHPNVTGYSVSYTYRAWNSATRASAATSTATVLSSGVVRGPGPADACMGIAHDSPSHGAVVGIWSCAGVPGQQWATWSDGTLRANGLCLDITGNSTVMAVVVTAWDCTGVGGQIWIPRADGSVFNPQSGYCLDSPGGSTDDGTQLRTWTCNRLDAQRWTFG